MGLTTQRGLLPASSLTSSPTSVLSLGMPFRDEANRIQIIVFKVCLKVDSFIAL